MNTAYLFKLVLLDPYTFSISIYVKQFLDKKLLYIVYLLPASI